MCHPPTPDHAGDAAHGLQQLTLGSGTHEFSAWLALPDSTAPAPGVVVLSDMFGPTPFYFEVTRRLAAEGYAAILPDLFSRMDPLPEVTIAAARERLERLPDRDVEEDVSITLEAFKRHPRVRSDRVGTIGFCMGGTWALLLSALRDDLRAGVCLYGFPVQRERAPWKLYEPVALVERFTHPVLGLWGDLDNSVPMEHVERLSAELVRHGKPHEIVIYPGADHSFMVPDGWHIPHRDNPPGVADDAWNRITAFFEAHLREGVAPEPPASQTSAR